MMEMLSKRWSRGLEMGMGMQRRQQGCPQGHHTPADSLLGGCLQGFPSSSPHSASPLPPPTVLWLLYSNLEVTTTYPSLMPSFLARLAPFPGWAPRGIEQEEGTFVQSPRDDSSSGQGQAEGPMPSPLPSSFPAPRGMCPQSLTNLAGGSSSQRGLCPATHPL